MQTERRRYPPQYNAQAISNNGIFKPIIVQKGQVIGLWKRTIKPKIIVIDLQPFDVFSEELEGQIKARFDDYRRYLGFDE